MEMDVVYNAILILIQNKRNILGKIHFFISMIEQDLKLLIKISERNVCYRCIGKDYILNT